MHQLDRLAQDWVEGRQSERVTQESTGYALAIRWGKAMDGDHAD